MSEMSKYATIKKLKLTHNWQIKTSIILLAAVEEQPDGNINH